MQPLTPTYSDARSETSAGFGNSLRYGRRGVDYTKFRTRLCRNFQAGAACPFGDRCAFSHGEAEESGRRAAESDVPPPPSYAEAVQTEAVMPPAYPSRFRHDPYSFNGVMFE